MLAGKAPEDLSTLNYPVLVSPKLDGIRCLIRGGQAVSRTLKPIRNKFIQEQLKGLPDGLDGELVTGDYNTTQGDVMRSGGEPDFTYHVFDWDMGEKFSVRHGSVVNLLGYGPSRVVAVPHQLLKNYTEVDIAEDLTLEAGYEGLMIRDPDGPYKYGRSTTREGYLLKLKRFEDAEAEIIGVVERMHNDNEATKDAFGRTERSSHKAGKRPAGDLGALRCRTADGAEFEIGTGFSAADRYSLWGARLALTGMLVKFKHQPPPGGRKAGQAPRFPVFLGFRDREDM